ncbi:OmpA family protein [Paludibacterium denitrificans]|uniref:OmpA family protein n=1 Tax=Paludibacterium denitrificans TaxID=2675226 RepID=A0A844GAI5_9NEIS|nr:OmpA family protein [Paludibacterium denitrificans]MTD33466.1 OmpA family protein [Paludibacterium denitrificans]HJV07538.1 OmpA family protein [Chromobacteriaceae bacterium]
MTRSRLIPLLLTATLLSACAVQPQQKDITVTQTRRGVEIRSSEKILFDPGKADLKPGGAAFLDKVANILQTKTHRNVVIEGHTDNTGSAELNQDLSELRALSVMKELVNRGVAKNRIKAVGYGMNRPIASNATASGRQQNRRTEIIILGERKENIGDPLGDLVNSVVEFSKKLFNN